MTPRPSWLYLVVGRPSWPVVKVLFGHRASGVEHVPRLGGVVLAANHWSNVDPWPRARLFFPRRAFRFMAKAAVTENDAARIVTDSLPDEIAELKRSLA